MSPAATMNTTESSALGVEVQAGSRYRWVTRFGLATVLVLALVLAADQLLNPHRFPIKQVEISGSFVNASGAAVRTVVETNLQGNFFSVNLTELENAVEQVAWVYSSAIRRVWPSTIVVEIVEIKPVANWGDNKWLNFTGDLVSRPDDNVPETAAMLPKISGPESESRAIWAAFRNWSGQFSSVGLSLDSLSLDKTGLWTLELALGALVVNRSQDSEQPATRVVTMVVDRGDAERKVDRFIQALSRELIDRFPGMLHVDLRYPNGFAIQWQDGMDSGEYLSAVEQGPDTKTAAGN
jgi:cell division protein FtsQ